MLKTFRNFPKPNRTTFIHCTDIFSIPIANQTELNEIHERKVQKKAVHICKGNQKLKLLRPLNSSASWDTESSGAIRKAYLILGCSLKYKYKIDDRRVSWDTAIEEIKLAIR